MNTINLNIIRKNPLMIPVLIAKNKGLFDKYKVYVNLDITENFTFMKNTDFIDGKVDAMVGDVTFFFYMLKEGKKAVITSNLTRTINLVGGRNVPKDLNGIRVGANRAGLFRLYLENDLKDIAPNAKIVWINNTYERMKALEEGSIDALVAIEPFVTDVLEKGGRILWRSRSSDKNLVMWAFDKEFYEKNKKGVRNFHNAIEEAAMLFNSGTVDEKIKMAMEFAGYSKDMAVRLRDFEFEPQDNFRREDFELCQEWMYKEKEIEELYNSRELVCNLFNN